MSAVTSLARPEIVTLKAYAHAAWLPSLTRLHANEAPWRPSGDSTSAGIVCARAAGATPEQAAAFGCLVASITVQQIGTTGTATPEQVRQRRRELG